jgi:ferric-dicitrate binding protein FerR (iron transport regulator)
METEAWLEAARNYNLLNERARAEYWNQLTPEQQDALREASASSQPDASVSSVKTERASAPARRASPVVAAVVTAVVGLTGARWAEAPVSAPVAAVVAAPDLAYPAGPGGAVLDGRVVDDQG